MIESVLNLVSKKVPSAVKSNNLIEKNIENRNVIHRKIEPVPVNVVKEASVSTKKPQGAPVIYNDGVLTGNYPPPRKSFYHDKQQSGEDDSDSRVTERFAMKVFAIPSANRIAADVCSALDIPMGRLRCKTFADGECAVTIHDNVNEQSCFLVASSPGRNSGTSHLHRCVMETLLTLSAMNREGASDITVVLPYFPYFRHNNRGSPDKAVGNGCADMARLLSALGASRVILFDVHIPQVDAFFEERLPVTNLNAHDIIADYIAKQYRKDIDGEDIVVCATSADGGFKSKALSSRLRNRGMKSTIAVNLRGVGRRGRPKMSGDGIILSDGKIVKPDEYLRQAFQKAKSDVRSGMASGPDHSEPEDEPIKPQDHMSIVGDVKEKTVLIYDDICDTGESAMNTANLLKKSGAKKIVFAATHALLSKGSIDRLLQSPVSEIIFTDTLNIGEEGMDEKVTVLRVGKLLSEAIYRLHNNIHISDLHLDEHISKVNLADNEAI